MGVGVRTPGVCFCLCCSRVFGVGPAHSLGSLTHIESESGLGSLTQDQSESVVLGPGFPIYKMREASPALLL